LYVAKCGAVRGATSSAFGVTCGLQDNVPAAQNAARLEAQSETIEGRLLVCSLSRLFGGVVSFYCVNAIDPTFRPRNLCVPFASRSSVCFICFQLLGDDGNGNATETYGHNARVCSRAYFFLQIQLFLCLCLPINQERI
jgi:hypothetical protein